MNNKILAVIAICVIVVAAVGATVLTIGDKTEPVVETGRLVVYGNANNDDYLDERDVDFLKQIVSGESEWDSEKYPFADTDTDGEITQADIDLLNKFLKKEESIMRYYDYAGTVQSIHYPITGNLSVIYNYGLDAAIILGCYDRVVAASNNVITTATNTETRYPGLKSMVNIRDPVGDPQDLLQAGIDHDVKAIFGIGESYVTTIQNSLKAANSDIDVITISTSGYAGRSCDYLGGIITLGVMFGCEDNAYDYIKFVDGAMDRLEENLADVDPLSCVIVHNTSNASTTQIRTTSTSGAQAGNAHTYAMLPLVDMFAGQYGAASSTVNIEDIAKMNPDVILISSWALISDAMTYDEGQKAFENMAQYLRICPAYDKGMVFGATFESYGTFSGPPALPLLAAFIWPDLVDEDWAWDVLQEYYDKYTMLDVDVSKVGCFAPNKL